MPAATEHLLVALLSQNPGCKADAQLHMYHVPWCFQEHCLIACIDGCTCPVRAGLYCDQQVDEILQFCRYFCYFCLLSSGISSMRLNL